MPISREPQVSDLGFCDRETANLGLARQSPSIWRSGGDRHQLVAPTLRGAWPMERIPSELGVRSPVSAVCAHGGSARSRLSATSTTEFQLSPPITPRESA